MGSQTTAFYLLKPSVPQTPQGSCLKDGVVPGGCRSLTGFLHVSFGQNAASAELWELTPRCSLAPGHGLCHAAGTQQMTANDSAVDEKPALKAASPPAGPVLPTELCLRNPQGPDGHLPPHNRGGACGRGDGGGPPGPPACPQGWWGSSDRESCFPDSCLLSLLAMPSPTGKKGCRATVF